MHVKGVNYEPQAMLLSTIIDVVLLPSHGIKLNQIKFVFNVMAQRFKSRHYESTLNTDHNALVFLSEVIDSITPDIKISRYQKCGHVNYF